MIEEFLILYFILHFSFKKTRKIFSDEKFSTNEFLMQIGKHKRNEMCVIYHNLCVTIRVFPLNKKRREI